MMLPTLMIAVQLSCGVVLPTHNVAYYTSWNAPHRTIEARYRDMDGIHWLPKAGVPFYIHILTTQRKGTKPRFGCSTTHRGYPIP